VQKTPLNKTLTCPHIGSHESTFVQCNEELMTTNSSYLPTSNQTPQGVKTQKGPPQQASSFVVKTTSPPQPLP
jgi:hypothetical protein